MGVRHGQGADNVVEFFMIPEMAVSVTGNEGVMHLRCGLGKTSHTIEGFGVQLNAQRRLRQVSTNDQDHADDHSNSKATTLLPTNGARDSRAKHNRRREVIKILKERSHGPQRSCEVSLMQGSASMELPESWLLEPSAMLTESWGGSARGREERFAHLRGSWKQTQCQSLCWEM